LRAQRVGPSTARIRSSFDDKCRALFFGHGENEVLYLVLSLYRLKAICTNVKEGTASAATLIEEGFAK